MKPLLVLLENTKEANERIMKYKGMKHKGKGTNYGSWVPDWKNQRVLPVLVWKIEGSEIAILHWLQLPGQLIDFLRVSSTQIQQSQGLDKGHEYWKWAKNDLYNE